MAATPGILYVTMTYDRDTLSEAAFTDWYNNEHGPLRLRLQRFVQNGFRYAATDLSDSSPSSAKPEWMAIYDLTDMDELLKDDYLALRSAPVQSQRERDLRPHLTIDRRSYDLVKTWTSPKFTNLDRVADGLQNVMVAVNLYVHDAAGGVEAAKWYDEEHVAELQKVPGWLRTRRFARSAQDSQKEVDYLALHEYAPDNGLGGPEFQAAVSTPWALRVMDKVVREKKRRVYKLHYTFGAAPRDLAPLRESGVKQFDSPATLTCSIPSSSGGAIESYVATADGARLQYRLEGSADQTAPVLVLVNSILVDYGIWDAFVTTFLAQNPQYRVLRYLSRGRTAAFGSLTTPITVSLLASDIIALLDALRIPQAAAAVGVSLGGATVLCAGLTYPGRIARFLACDTSAKSPAGNAQAWGERIAMAEKEGAVATSADASGAETRAVVGKELANITARRWFVPESYDGGALEAECLRVERMVAANDLEGFKASVRALWEYDLTPKMAGFEGKGAFLVGAQDGALPKSMAEMAKSLGPRGARLSVVQGAGHLPMVERPGEVVKAVEELLAV